MEDYNPLEVLDGKFGKEVENKTKLKKKERDKTVLRTVRTYKHLVKEVQQLLLDYEEYKSITDFVSKAIKEKLEKERKKHK